MAWQEAKSEHKDRIESHHFLKSMIQLKNCMAMKVLSELGVDSIEVNQGIASILSQQDNSAL